MKIYKWEDPPGYAGIDDVIPELVANPGQWALVSKNESMRTHLADRQSLLTEGAEIFVIASKVEYRWTIYARWVN